MAILSRSAAASPCCAIAGKCRWRSTFAIRRGGVAVFLLTCAMAMGNLADLRTQNPPPGEYEVKAAFLYNFAKFVEWPGGPAGKTIVIGILGSDPFGAVIDFTFEDKVIAGKRFEIRRFQRIDQLQVCHVLFISDSEQKNFGRILEAVRGMPVLTVSDARDFVSAGGVIELVLEDSKIRFDINLSEAKNSGLRISAQLLQLARKVDGR